MPASAYRVVLDPPAVAVGRTELNLNSGAFAIAGGEGKGIDWGESAIKAFLAEQQFGEAPTDYRVPNRMVTIPLLLGAADSRSVAAAVAAEEQAREQLQQKVALFQRQGGVLLREGSKGEKLYADIVNASLIVPDVWGEVGGVEPNVMLKLECLPDFYGEEIELDPISGSEATGQVAAVLKQGGKPAVIAGDYPGRARIQLTEKSGNSQRSLLWGFRATRYSSLATAALFFDAYALTTINAATSAAEAGTYSGKIVKLASPEPNVWHPFLELTSSTIVTGGEITTKHLQHIGSYRVWARIAGTAGQLVRLAWSTDDATAPTLNAATTLTEGGWSLVDLGELRLEETPVGEHWWTGVLQVETGGEAHEVRVDRIWLQPLEDGAGRLRATGVPSSTLLGPTRLPTAATTVKPGEPPEFIEWSKPTAVLSPGEAAAAVLAPGKQTRLLVLTGFGFAIPAGVTITGVEIELNWRFASAQPGNFSVQLYKGGLLGSAKGGTGINIFNGPLGGPSDLWSAGLTRAIVNEAGFGVAIQAGNQGGNTLNGEAQVTYPLTMRVFYSYSASAFSADGVLYANRVSEIRFDGAYREDTITSSYVRVSEETGDLPRIPPSGMENRECQLFLKNSRGLLPDPGGSETGEEDAGIDKLQAVVSYRPCYVGRI